MTAAYRPLREARDLALPVRGLTYHVNAWGDASLVTPDRPPLLMLHGWMDVGASFQFVVDALARADGAQRYGAGPGLARLRPQQRRAGTTATGLPDYLGDLDAWLDRVARRPVDLLGHSMGGNVVMLYAGVRPARIRRLVNLEGFGLPDSAPTRPHSACEVARRAASSPQELPYADAAAVAQRLRKNNPRLSADKARLAGAALGRGAARTAAGACAPTPRTSASTRCSTAWPRAGDLARHRRAGAVGGRRADRHAQVVGRPFIRGPSSKHAWPMCSKVLSVTLEDAGHMLHHDQPEALAAVRREPHRRSRNCAIAA
jgi:pimeloyl-ACP methyl ester carboxylesterase